MPRPPRTFSGTYLGVVDVPGDRSTVTVIDHGPVGMPDDYRSVPECAGRPMVGDEVPGDVSGLLRIEAGVPNPGRESARLAELPRRGDLVGIAGRVGEGFLPGELAVFRPLE